MRTPPFLLVACAYFLQTPDFEAGPLDVWEKHPRPENSPPLFGVAFANDLFVAVGSGGAIATSADGIQWSAQNSGKTNDLFRVKAVNGRFFVFPWVGSSTANFTLTSTDGTNWTVLKETRDITYANGAYWATTGERSVDLIDWTPASPDLIGHFVEFGNSTFLVTQLMRTRYSADGTNWTWGSDGWQGNGIVISFRNGLFFSSGLLPFREPVFWYPYYRDTTRSTVSYSTDAQTWHLSLKLPDPDPNAGLTGGVEAGGNYYVTAGASSIYYTTNLTSNWTTVALPINPGTLRLTTVAYGAHAFVAILGGDIYRSNPVDGGFAPEIHAHPQSFSVVVGGTVILSVGVHGSDPMSFQWRRNGADVPGANLQTLTLTNVTFDSAGEYDVIVTNSAGSITSGKGMLSIHFADVHTYSGVTLRGNVGDKFLMEYQDSLDSAGQWRHLTNVTLNSSSYIWVDYESPNQPKRFYRATYQGR